VSTAHTASATANGPLGRQRRADGPVSWLRDLSLGVRLAVGGGRTSWSRLALGTIGIGLAAAILLIAASVPTMLQNRSVREQAATPVTSVRAGVSPLYEVRATGDYRDEAIGGNYVFPTGANSPVPPGLSRLPAQNEVVLSPALADLLNSPAGAMLRPRFPEKVIGTIGEAGLPEPTELEFFAGAGAQLTGAEDAQPVYGFGPAPGKNNKPLDPLLVALLIVGVVVLLLPIMIFVGVSSRIAGAERDRRLAALRLVGAGAFQTRRIAAAESLVSAATGLILGAVLFLLARQAAGGVELLQTSVFTNDVDPAWPLLIMVIVIIPFISVSSALLAMRRTVIEPLGVVREARPVRRRLWWRLSLIVVGAALLLLLSRTGEESERWTAQLAVGATALLIGVPAMLPWLLERTVSAMRGGRPSWQLAVRRLQLDSGTPARVVGGVAVVLAGAIALQTVLVAAYSRYQLDGQTYGTTTSSTGQVLGLVQVSSTGDVFNQVSSTLRGAQGVHSVISYQNLDVAVPHAPIVTKDENGNPIVDDTPDEDNLSLASCQVIQEWLQVSGCQDGDVYYPVMPPEVPDPSGNGSQIATAPVSPQIPSGTKLNIVGDYGSSDTPPTIGTWTVPANVKKVTTPGTNGATVVGDLIITPGAFHNAVPLSELSGYYFASVDQTANSVEYVRNALAPYTWKTQAYAEFTLPGLSDSQQTLVTIRRALLVGSLFTLLLAGASLLVLALEQIRERRRPLAALAATGVPRSMLARSLLWQTAVPVLLAVVVAILIGLALAALVLRFTSIGMVFDWADIGVFSGSAAGLALLVTALTLPALRNATKLGALRAE
jgi:hypothetical protein